MDFDNTNAMTQMKVIFIVHLILATWGIQGFWSPDSYFFYNLILLCSLMWSIHAKDNAEPLQIAIGINVVSVLLDIIVLATYFPTSTHSSERFSAGMAIIHLVARPITTFFMSRNCSQRFGIAVDNFSNLFNSGGPSSGLAGTGTGRSRYEDIDSGPPITRT